VHSLQLWPLEAGPDRPVQARRSHAAAHPDRSADHLRADRDRRGERKLSGAGRDDAVRTG
jgi:hypothetical protein